MDGRALRDSLKAHAKERGIDTLEFFRRFAMERLVVRLAEIDTDDRIAMKGGIIWLLNKELVAHARPTADLDVHFHAPKSHAEVIGLIEEARLFDAGDAVTFEVGKAHVLQHQGDHDGLRVYLRAWIGPARADFHVDVGFGGRKPAFIQKVEFGSLHPRLRGSSILMLPLEYIAAEKFAAVMQHGMGNTRLKDFNDLFVLADWKLDDDKLAEAVVFTFEDKGHTIPRGERTTGLTQAYAVAKQPAWTAWLRGARREDMMPADFGDVVEKVAAFADRSFLLGHVRSVGNGLGDGALVTIGR